MLQNSKYAKQDTILQQIEDCSVPDVDAFYCFNTEDEFLADLAMETYNGSYDSAFKLIEKLNCRWKVLLDKPSNNELYTICTIHIFEGDKLYPTNSIISEHTDATKAILLSVYKARYL